MAPKRGGRVDSRGNCRDYMKSWYGILHGCASAAQWVRDFRWIIFSVCPVIGIQCLLSTVSSHITNTLACLPTMVTNIELGHNTAAITMRSALPQQHHHHSAQKGCRFERIYSELVDRTISIWIYERTVYGWMRKSME